MIEYFLIQEAQRDKSNDMPLDPGATIIGLLLGLFLSILVIIFIL